MAYPHGLFSWTDVYLPDPAAGREFYSNLFGWDAEDARDPDGNYIYTGFSKDGRAVAGLGPLPLGSPDSPYPPMWNSYVTVRELDDTLARWKEAGGTVLLPAIDVMTAGRMAVVADPQGAVLSLWQAGDSAGGEVFGEHGALAWNELNTRDSAAAREFYGAVLGWKYEEFAAGPAEYWIVRLEAKESGQPYRDDKYNGGVLTMDENWPAEIPPHWMVYFHVDDTDALVARLTGLGGQVSVPAFDTEVGRIAVVADPQGGTFSVISPPAA